MANGIIAFFIFSRVISMSTIFTDEFFFRLFSFLSSSMTFRSVKAHKKAGFYVIKSYRSQFFFCVFAPIVRSPKANFNSNYNLPCIAISFIIIVCEKEEEDDKFGSYLGISGWKDFSENSTAILAFKLTFLIDNVVATWFPRGSFFCLNLPFIIVPIPQ